VKIPRYDAMEALARRHAELDKTTAMLWQEEADLCSQLKTVDFRLQMLRRARSGVRQEKGPGERA
jgi:hypothetical protein